MKYIVTYTDFGENCDYHSRMMGTYDTREEAESEIEADMAALKRNYGEGNYVQDGTELWKSGEFEQTGCVWDIHEIN